MFFRKKPDKADDDSFEIVDTPSSPAAPVDDGVKQEGIPDEDMEYDGDDLEGHGVEQTPSMLDFDLENPPKDVQQPTDEELMRQQLKQRDRWFCGVICSFLILGALGVGIGVGLGSLP